MAVYTHCPILTLARMVLPAKDPTPVQYQPVHLCSPSLQRTLPKPHLDHISLWAFEMATPLILLHKACMSSAFSSIIPLRSWHMVRRLSICGYLSHSGEACQWLGVAM